MFPIKKYLPFFILAFIYGYITGRYWQDFSLHYSQSEYEKRYGHSQYVLGPAYTHLMGDGDIYTYAGIRYAQGEDPTAINFEHPPVIKYIFGLSYLLFSIPNLANVVFLVIAAISFWNITSTLFVSMRWRYITTAIFLLHPIVYSYYIQTMLDFGTMALSLAVIACYVKVYESDTNLKKSGLILFMGLFLASKYPLPINALLPIFLLCWLRLKKRITYASGVVIGLGAGAVYLLTYSSFFMHHHSLYSWLKFEWNRWQWYQGKLGSQWGSLFQVIFTGRRPVVWDMCPSYAKVKWWHVGVPLTFVVYITSWIEGRRHFNHILAPYFIWTIIAFCILLLGADSDRFLVPLIPGWTLFGMKWLEIRTNGKVSR